MELGAALRCLAGGLLAATALGAMPTLAREAQIGRDASAFAWVGETGSGAAMRETPIDGGRSHWGTRLNLSKTVTLRASSDRPSIVSTGSCGASGLDASLGGPCRSNGGDRFEPGSYAFVLDVKVDSDHSVYAKTGKAYRIGVEQLRTIGTIGGADTSIIAGREIRFEHVVGVRSHFIDGKVTLNMAGYYNKVKSIHPIRTFTTPTGARYSTFVDPTVQRNMGLEADLTVRPAAGLGLYGSAATNREKYKLCAGGMCPAHAPDIVQTQFNVGANYTRAFDGATLGLNLNYNWTGRGRLAGDSVTAAEMAAALGLPAADYDRTLVRRSAGTLDMRATLSLADSMVEIYAYGRNLTDQRFLQHRRFAYDVARSSMWNEPRSYGLGATMAF